MRQPRKQQGVFSSILEKRGRKAEIFVYTRKKRQKEEFFRSYSKKICSRIDEPTIDREYAPLECIADNYEKVVVSLDDMQLPSRGGIRHVRAWELSKML